MSRQINKLVRAYYELKEKYKDSSYVVQPHYMGTYIVTIPIYQYNNWLGDYIVREENLYYSKQQKDYELGCLLPKIEGDYTKSFMSISEAYSAAQDYIKYRDNYIKLLFSTDGKVDVERLRDGRL